MEDRGENKKRNKLDSHTFFLPFLLMIGPLYTFCILMSNEDFTIKWSVAAKSLPLYMR